MRDRAVMINVSAVNNSGKTAVTEYLEKYYSDKGFKAVRVKYPVYIPEEFGAEDTENTGKRINAYLREGNPENWDMRTAQMFYAKNRIYFDKTIEKWLKEKDVIISEDGKYTSIIWGPLMDPKLTRREIEEWNKDIIEPDISFTLNGHRLGGIETAHKFENSDQWYACQDRHLKLAKELGWKIIDYKKVEGEDEIKKETARVALEMVKAAEYLFK